MEQEQKQLDAIDKTLCVLISIELALFFIMLVIGVWVNNDLIRKIIASDAIVFLATLLVLKVYHFEEK